ncbi:MAG TPA: hypothetical protein VF131_09100 [Blastocatellia bacterium]|nr:hypothetical protein [Blastocatellia bacterium]
MLTNTFSRAAGNDLPIVRRFTDGNKATLGFVIPDAEGRVEGKVNMHLENKQWKVGKVGLKDENGKVTF